MAFIHASSFRVPFLLRSSHTGYGTVTSFFHEVPVFLAHRKFHHLLGSQTHIMWIKDEKYKACPNESGTEVGAPLFPAVELCDFSGRWQCMSGEIWYTLDSGSVLLTETEAR